MRKDPEQFDGLEPVLVYVARKLRHARRVEVLLTEAGIDYAVETDVIAAGFVFRTQRVGAFFYVAAADASRARSTLSAEGFTLTVSTDTP